MIQIAGLEEMVNRVRSAKIQFVPWFNVATNLFCVTLIIKTNMPVTYTRRSNPQIPPKINIFIAELEYSARTLQAHFSPKNIVLLQYYEREIDTYQSIEDLHWLSTNIAVFNLNRYGQRYKF